MGLTQEARERKLSELWAIYRPDVPAFTKYGLLVGHSQQEIDQFLDEPSDRENDDEWESPA